MSKSTAAKATETIEDRRQRRMAEQTAAREEALKRVLTLTRRTNISSPNTHPWGGGLHFEPSGAARMTGIAGFIQGLVMAGETMGNLEALATTGAQVSSRDLAVHLAVSIDEKLRYLAEYGGQREIEVEPAEGDRAAQTVEVPAYKVVLYDDGTFGGFGVLWHKPCTTEEIQAQARKHDEASYQGREEDGTPLNDALCRQRWSAALDKAREELRIRKGLEDSRYWTPSWVKAKREAYTLQHEEEGHEGYSYHGCKSCNVGSYELSSSCLYVEYGFAFNGGLLLHGMGHPTYAVRLTNDDGPSWSIHT